jgi:anti-sigma factor ChrR (cupin superfamily)
MKSVALATSAIIGAACLITPTYADDAHPAHTMLTPDAIQWKDAPGLPPGTKIAVIEGPMNEAGPFTMRIKLPANSKTAAHWHPGIEHVTVLAGTFSIGLGDKLDESKVTPLPAGSIAIMQPKTNHFVVQKDEAIIQLHGIGPWQINYVNPADDPRKTN